MKNYTELRKLPIERIWKQSEIVSKRFSKILESEHEQLLIWNLYQRWKNWINGNKNNICRSTGLKPYLRWQSSLRSETSFRMLACCCPWMSHFPIILNPKDSRIIGHRRALFELKWRVPPPRRMQLFSSSFPRIFGSGKMGQFLGWGNDSARSKSWHNVQLKYPLTTAGCALNLYDSMMTQSGQLIRFILGIHKFCTPKSEMLQIVKTWRNIIIFNLYSPLAPVLGRIDTCIH